LAIGLETRRAFIPSEIALQLLVCEERAVGLVKNSKGLIAGDLKQVIDVRVNVVRGYPIGRRNQNGRACDKYLFSLLAV
jgi:hypothetical protein